MIWRYPQEYDVIVIGGFSMATTKLVERVKHIIRGKQPEAANDGWAKIAAFFSKYLGKYLGS